MNQHNPLQAAKNCATIQPEQSETVTISREELLNMRREVISLLLKLDERLGYQPTVLTRAERRRR